MRLIWLGELTQAVQAFVELEYHRLHLVRKIGERFLP
jgi:hypothetical protein